MRGRLVVAVAVAASALLWLCALSHGVHGVSQTQDSWTIMVYMANDFWDPLPWQENINSMEAAPQVEGVNVIALIDNDMDGDSTLLKIAHDPGGASGTLIVSSEIDDGEAVIPPTGEVDMADPATLTAFVEFAASEFPADRLVLVLWGHGAGWHGLCPDKADLLGLTELGSALGEATSHLGRSLDMVVIDACAEATLEVVAEIAPSADYFVGAENNVPFQGLPYERILQSLADSPDQSVEDFGSTIVSKYIEYAWFVSPYSATMAMFDLNRMGRTFSLLDSLSELGVKYNSIFHETVNEALSSAEFYDTEWYVDFVDLLTIIYESDLPLEMRMTALETAVSFREAIVAFEKYDHPDPYDGVGVARANGAVIYAPTDTYYEAEYYSLALSASGHWDEFGTLARFVMATEPMVPGPVLSYVDSDGDSMADAAVLDWQADHPLVEAWVYGRLPNGLVLLATMSSIDSNISIEGLVGDLVLAASAVDTDGNALSYSTVNATLPAQVRVTVTLMDRGERVGNEYDVFVSSSTFSGFAIADGGRHVITLTIPSQAVVGEMMLVQVMSGQEVLVDSRFILDGGDAAVAIDLHGAGKDAPRNDAALLAFSLLPAALLAIFTAMLYLDYRKKYAG